MATFRQSLASMISYLQEKGSKLTDFSPTSVVYQILATVASVTDQIQYSIDKAQNQAYISTATGSGLDAKGQDLGVPRKQPTQAVWVFTFSKKQAPTQDIVIPKGTVVTTLPQPGLAPITFTVDETTFLPIGTLNVTVRATCRTAGSIGNIAVNTPLLIGSATPGIDSVQLLSTDQGTLGFDIEEDDEYRKRLLLALASKAQGTKTWYEQSALTVEGVQLATVVPFERGPGTVDIYIVGDDNTMPSQELINEVQAVIDVGRIITDDAKVMPPTPRYIDLSCKVQIDEGYAQDATLERVKLSVKNYVAQLGIGGGSTHTLYLSQVIRTVLSVEGVQNVWDVASGDGGDILFTSKQLPLVRNLDITPYP
ncbi:baseplate J/gp47 family protein [Tumebacillus sp. ITR2]|uniref:Baseplate J/gp47 family protein n=1 Tax=Tumebacillus amylolyticus TaxID=2801339 RepID=A0ABS1J7L0_9BACL|nr:baseplate J/gp47 family protein [Tumebacillus amylolyticus]MBL0386234.1 baseplate J/gp47 family protein [Tumebacillus amylolyticus]